MAAIGEKRVILTAQDIRAVRQAKVHYEIFVEGAEKQGDEKTAGMLRSQVFYLEQMLSRIDEAEWVN